VQDFNLGPEMILKFINIGGANRWPFLEIITPLPDPFFQSWFTDQFVTPLILL